MPRLLVEKGPDRGKSRTLKVGEQLIVGRDAGVDFQLTDSLCSRRHLMIASKGSVFGCKDLNSANGTLVNGRRTEGAVKLAYGDSIQLGDSLLSWLPDEHGKKSGGLIGHVLAGYRIEERLGRGAMGTVYKAIQLSLGRTIALKVLSPDLTKDARFCDMFIKEARAAGALNHPNIIQVYDVGEENGQYFFSMEYAQKGSVLEELSETGKISLKRSIEIIKDGCLALDYAEKKGLVHRDIKPDNLMVDEDSTVKLGDLGLAMSAQELQSEQDGVFGTPHYIAPEQAMGKAIDHRADIYAMGATFFRILTGETLFQGQTVKEILKKQVRERHRPITQVLHDCPRALETIIDRMLAKNPAERYQHGGDVLSDLESWENLAARKGKSAANAFAARPGAMTAEQARQMARTSRSRSLAIAAVAAALAVIALLVVLKMFVFSGDGPSVIGAGNDNSAMANTNTGSPGDNRAGTGGKLPKVVERANSELQRALTVADYLQSEDPPKLEEAIEKLRNALNDNPRATRKMKKKVTNRIAMLEESVLTRAKSAEAVMLEKDDLLRDQARDIEVYKFEAALARLNAFVTNYKDHQNPEIQALWQWVKTYIDETYPHRVQGRIEKLENNVNAELKRAKRLTKQARVAVLEEQLKIVIQARVACDQEEGRGRFQAKREEIEGLLKIYRAELEGEEKAARQIALKRAEGRLTRTMETIQEAIQRGDFLRADSLLAAFETGNRDYNDYKDLAVFKSLTADIARRRAQTDFEYQALAELDNARKRGLPTITAQRALLKKFPWPASVQKVFGDGQAPLRLDVERTKSRVTWTLEILSGGKVKKLGSDEFVDLEKARALATAIVHLMNLDQDMRNRMQKPIGGKASNPAIATGLGVWMLEMEADEQALIVLEKAYGWTGASHPSRPLVREYLAWALLKRWDTLRKTKGRETEAGALWARLQREFAGTRALQGEFKD